jgi:hypothetical protein
MNQETMSEKVLSHDETLYGKKGEMGIAHKVTVLWRAHVWVLCVLSAGLGFMVRPWLESFFGK